MVQRTPPTFQNPESERGHRLEHLVAVCRVLADVDMHFGVAGHVSVRDPIETDHFWLNPYGRHFGALDIDDLIMVSPGGEVVSGEGILHGPAYSIHGSVLATRPDINAAVHVHSEKAQALAATSMDLVPLTQEATAFFETHSVHPYEGIRVDDEEGKSIAASLGDGIAVLMRNHGLLTVGRTVDAAAWRAIAMERACAVQLAAVAAGPLEPIPPSLAREIGPLVGSESEGWLNFQPLFEQVHTEQIPRRDAVVHPTKPFSPVTTDGVVS